MHADDLREMTEIINLGIAAWQHFGWEQPPAPNCFPIPPLGERSAEAVKNGHQAVNDIDRMIARLHEIRAELVSELRQDENMRMEREI